MFELGRGSLEKGAQGGVKATVKKIVGGGAFFYTCPWGKSSRPERRVGRGGSRKETDLGGLFPIAAEPA